MHPSSVKLVQLGMVPNLQNLIVSSGDWFKKKKSPKSVVRDHQKEAAARHRFRGVVVRGVNFGFLDIKISSCRGLSHYHQEFEAYFRESRQ
jgi:hypothetical protein